MKKKVIVIMGGTTGMGLSAALAFTSAGARVVVVGRNGASVAAAQKLLGKSGVALRGDATNPSTARKAIGIAVEKFGGFHGFYHVAGGSGRRMGDGPLHEVTDQGWEGTLKLNLTSVFNSNRAATRQFLKQKSAGTILNLGSVLGFSPSPKYFGTHAYAAAKAAIIGLTRSAAAFYAPSNIRFNVLAPAATATPMSKRLQEDETLLRFVAGKQPLDGGRIGMPRDLDAAAVYFMSEESRFVTGQVLAIDGGWSVTEGQAWK